MMETESSRVPKSSSSTGRAARVAGWLALPAGLAVALAVLFWRDGGAPRVPGTESGPTFFEQDGFRVEMTASSPARPASRAGAVSAWANSELRFDVKEKGEAGRPLAGLRPLAWLVRREDGEALPDRGKVKEKIQSLLASRVAPGYEINLNEYVVVTLDDNPSISIIDPQVGSSKTKVIGVVTLLSKGADFVLADDRRNVLVTLPESKEVAVADLSKRIASHIDVPGEPFRIAYQPDRRFVWVGDRSGGSVTAIDAQTLTAKARVAVMPGPHEFAFRGDGRKAFVASPASSRVAVIDVDSMAVERTVDLDVPAAAIAYSDFGGRAYAALETGAILAIDGHSFETVAEIELPDGSSGFTVTPDGRWGFVLNRSRNLVTIVDTATNRAAYTIPVEEKPDRVDFTEKFAYIRHAASELVVLVELPSIGEATTPIASTIVLGRKPPMAGGITTPAPLLAPLPEGGGALVLNPADRIVYHFVEGMNAPTGEYLSYPWTAKGILIADRTIREVEKGRYLSEFQSPRPGSYTVAFLVPSSPQIYGCFDLSVEGDERLGPDAVPLSLEPVFASERFSPNAPGKLVVRLTDRTSGEPVDRLRDVLFVVTRGPRFQWRGAAKPLGDGRYEVDVPFEDAGRYMVVVGCSSRGIRPGQLESAWAVVAGDEPKAAAVEPRKERS